MRERPLVLGEDWQRADTGIFLPGPAAKVRSAQPLAVGLFSGAGGFDLGLIEAGFHVIGASDYDADATITYLYNLARPGVQVHFVTDADEKRLSKRIEAQWRYAEKMAKKQGTGAVIYPLAGGGWISSRPDVRGCEHFWFGDIRELTGERMLDDLGLESGDLDLVVGGPPCQGFSTSGKRDVADPRNTLVFDFCRLVCELNPKSMAMENVPAISRMVTVEGINMIDAISRVLTDGGFGAYDALRRSLMTTSGMGAAMKGAAKPERAARAGEQDIEDDAVEEVAAPWVQTEIAI